MPKIEKEIDYLTLVEFMTKTLPEPLKIRQWSNEYGIYNEVVEKSGSVLTANRKVGSVSGNQIHVLDQAWMADLVQVAEDYEKYREGDVVVKLTTRFRKPIDG